MAREIASKRSSEALSGTIKKTGSRIGKKLHGGREWEISLAKAEEAAGRGKNVELSQKTMI